MKSGDIAVWGASAEEGSASFCTGERNGGTPECFAVDLGTGVYKKIEGGGGAGAAPAVKVETTATEVSVCVAPEPAAEPAEPPADGAEPPAAPEPKCTVIKPKLPKGSEDQLVAAASAKTAVIMVGQAAEVWDVVKNKRLTSIKFQKGDYACGTPAMLGETIFINAKACEGPSARGALYNTKGKKIADVGGKAFGTFGEEGLQAVMLEDGVYAFLDEAGAQVAIQDVVKGKVIKTIDFPGLWSLGAAPAAPEAPADAPAEGDAPAEPPPEAASEPIGNPGKSLLTLASPGKLVVVSGSPTPGNLAVIDTAGGDPQLIAAPVCK